MNRNSWIIIVFVLVIAVAAGLYFGRNMFAPGQTTVTIRRYYEEPESLRSDDTVILQGDNQGEFAEVVVDGLSAIFSLCAWNGTIKPVIWLKLR